MSNRLFHSWVNPKLDLPLLLVLAICMGISSGISPQIGTYMVSALSTNPADASMCNYAYFAGMTVTFSIIDRIKDFFTTKQLLLAICIALISCNALLARTDSAELIVLLTFFVGVFRIMGAILVISNLAPILMPQGQRYMLYCVYFPITLLVSPLGGLAMAALANNVNWRFAFHFCNLLLFVALLLVIVLVPNKEQGRRLPLWKFDWISHFLLAAWMLAFVYLIVYGRINDWFDSNNVRIAAVVFVLCIVLLLSRNLIQRKPFLRFEIFKERNIRVGMLLMFFLGAFFTMTNTMNTLMNISFHVDPLENAKVNTFPVIGYLIGTGIAYFYFRSYNNFKVMILATITFYWLSCVVLYFQVDSQISVGQLFLPMVLRGIAIILSYITIGLFVTADVPRKYLPVIPFFLIFFRTFLGPTVWGNLYSNWLAIRQVRLLDKIAVWSSSDIADPVFLERFHLGKGLDIGAIYRVYHQQAILSSVKELLGYLCIGGILMFVCVLFLPIYKKVDRQVFNWFKKKNLEGMATTVVS
ncbi:MULTISPECIES: MFS transporter [Chitinophagaceae]